MHRKAWKGFMLKKQPLNRSLTFDIGFVAAAGFVLTLDFDIFPVEDQIG